MFLGLSKSVCSCTNIFIFSPFNSHSSATLRKGQFLGINRSNLITNNSPVTMPFKVYTTDYGNEYTHITKSFVSGVDVALSEGVGVVISTIPIDTSLYEYMIVRGLLWQVGLIPVSTINHATATSHQLNFHANVSQYLTPYILSGMPALSSILYEMPKSGGLHYIILVCTRAGGGSAKATAVKASRIELLKKI